MGINIDKLSEEPKAAVREIYKEIVLVETIEEYKKTMGLLKNERMDGDEQNTG